MARGAIVITESMLAIGFTIIGVILLVITFNAIFTAQSSNVEDTGLSAIASELKVNLERVSASGSNVAKEVNFPSGVALNVIINQKDMEITYANQSGKRIKASFATDLNTQAIYNFYGPKTICILNIDSTITIIEGSCSCELLRREPCI